MAEHFSVHYSTSGMTAWLQAHGFVYKKAKGIPAKLDEKAQGDFVSSYEKLKEELPQDEMILFMDSSHPTQQTRLAYGWILKGESHYIPTTAGRHRVNVMAAAHHLNPSERLWHVMHQHVSHNRYHPTKQSFVGAIQRFLTSDPPNLKEVIRKICHDRFQTISKI